MAMTYLPLHANMARTLKKGMTVVHNGQGNRQGMKGVINFVNESNRSQFVVIKYKEGCTQSYSKNWFMDNFYIFVGDIKTMGGYFNGVPYLAKYAHFTCSNTKLKLGRQPTHKENKAVVEAKAAKVDPLDEVGTYLCLANGQLVCGSHKTQRLAEIAAGKHTKENKCVVSIVSVVSDSVPVCTSEIKRR
ncbi:hypothetical protein VPHD529_0023 [Vibrio phage D529]